MFNSLRGKLKNAFNKFAKEVDESSELAEGESEQEDKVDLKDHEIDSIDSKTEANEENEKSTSKKTSNSNDSKKLDNTGDELEKDNETDEFNSDEIEPEKEVKKGFFSRIFKKKIDDDDDEIDEHADSIDDVEKLDDTPIEEEELDIPDDIPDELNKVELESFQSSIKQKVKQFKEKSKTIFDKEQKDSADEELESAQEEENETEKDEKKGFLQRFSDSITKKVLSENAFNELFWELEITLLENNVAVEVIELIKENLSEEIVGKPIQRKDISVKIEDVLKSTIEKILDVEKPDFISEIPNKKPYKILIVGVNGSGKTTTIAKLVKLLQNKGFKSVIAAADTFRAAAIDQLQEHADNLNTKLIKHDYNSDPAAVAFDAIKYAEAKGLDTVVIDTAGRLHSNSNLMDELKKVYRVSKPDFTIFVGESITGNDCVDQAKEFQKAVDFNAIILSKADVDEKGGAAISVSFITKRPVIYLGVGQNYEDLEEFDKYKIMYRIFGE